MSRLETLREEAANVGLDLETYSPGDGKRRYTFYCANGHDMEAGVHLITCLGMQEARVWFNGYLSGFWKAKGSAA